MRELVHARGRELQRRERVEPARDRGRARARAATPPARPSCAPRRTSSSPRCASSTCPARASSPPRQPDGSKLPVRHCYDFNIVGTTISDDLDETTRAEMVRVLPARAADARVAARALAVGPGCLVQRAARPPVERRVHRLAGRRGPRARRARRAAGRARLAPRPRPHGEPGSARAGALRRGGAAAASTAERARRRRSCRTSTTGPARRRAPTSRS